MNLHDEILSRLQTLSGGPHDMHVDLGQGRLTCRLEQVDRLACRVQFLSLSTTALAGASMERLRQVSRTIAARVTYLLEPVGPLEEDQVSCTVQMRSIPPQRDAVGTRSYFELIVRRGGEVRVCRYEHAPGQARRPVAASLTTEVLARLAADITQAVDLK
jgi:hypothetical protein